MLSARRAPRRKALRDAVRVKQVELAEKTFALVAEGTPDEAFNALLFAIQDNTEVHRTVLPYRSWDLLGLIGRDQAHTLLRQSVRYCVKSEREWNHNAGVDRPRMVLPKLLDQYKLVGKPLGTNPAEDGWVERLSRAIFEGTPDTAADAAATAARGRISRTRSARRWRVGGESTRLARRGTTRQPNPSGEARRQRSWRFDWRPRLRFSQCLAEHGGRVEPA